MLEVLELGKNQISNVDLLQGTNQFPMLTELYLYINQIKRLPTNLSFAQLKTLNLNRNQDLQSLHLGYCPLLETLSVSYCSLNELGSMRGCPALSDLDVSFNHLPTLKGLLDVLPHRRLQALSLNDNLFSAISNEEAFYAQQNQTSTLQ